MSAIYLDLVLIDFLLALRGEIAARSHRERVRDKASDAGHDHHVLWRSRRRAEHAGDKAEVRRETVVEAVDRVTQESSRFLAMPRLLAGPGDRRKLGGVVG
jgi:hypothetical protein